VDLPIPCQEESCYYPPEDSSSNIKINAGKHEQHHHCQQGQPKEQHQHEQHIPAATATVTEGAEE
jgi:hypothetical protein